MHMCIQTSWQPQFERLPRDKFGKRPSSIDSFHTDRSVTKIPLGKSHQIDAHFTGSQLPFAYE